LDDVTELGAVRLSLPLSVECDDATLLCLEWQLGFIEFPAETAPLVSARPESASRGVSFSESGLSSDVSGLSSVVLAAAVVVVFVKDLFPNLSIWLG
jgi:hypothetical protein